PYDDIKIDSVHFEKILRNELTVCGSWNRLSSNFLDNERMETLYYMKTTRAGIIMFMYCLNKISQSINNNYYRKSEIYREI
ncbi:hypothetical protein EY01_14825, partial [Staphylococcus aureus]